MVSAIPSILPAGCAKYLLAVFGLYGRRRSVARHEFGIMERDPLPGELYDSYEPQNYACISVDDDLIGPILLEFNSADLFWHSLDMPGKGLEYCGITLIPPGSMDAVVQAIHGISGFSELESLLSEAKRRNKYVIHFGI